MGSCCILFVGGVTSIISVVLQNASDLAGEVIVLIELVFLVNHCSCVAFPCTKAAVNRE